MKRKIMTLEDEKELLEQKYAHRQMIVSTLEIVLSKTNARLDEYNTKIAEIDQKIKERDDATM